MALGKPGAQSFCYARNKMFMELDNDLRPSQPRHSHGIEQDVLRSLNVHNDKRILRPGDVPL